MSPEDVGSTGGPVGRGRKSYRGPGPVAEGHSGLYLRHQAVLNGEGGP